MGDNLATLHITDDTAFETVFTPAILNVGGSHCGHPAWLSIPLRKPVQVTPIFRRQATDPGRLSDRFETVVCH